MWVCDPRFALANWAQMVPDGLLVFFPSYGMLQSCVDYWKSTGTPHSIWDRITKNKQAVVEPRVSTLALAIVCRHLALTGCLSCIRRAAATKQVMG